MSKSCFTIVALMTISAATILAAEKPKQDKAGKPKVQAKIEQKPKAPSLVDLKKVVLPLLAKLVLTTEQQRKANALMQDDTWKDYVATFERKRNREIFAAAHKKIPEAMPTIMMPKMMAYNMEKNMKVRMAKQTGPPTPKEIEAIRSGIQKRMRVKFAPAIMGGLTDLTEKRMQELLLDKKVLVRTLADQVSEALLTDRQKREFDKTLTDAGYPKELTHGPDMVLGKRVVKMLEALADEVVAKLKKADAAEQK
jgi:hypothetical protein